MDLVFCMEGIKEIILQQVSAKLIGSCFQLHSVQNSASQVSICVSFCFHGQLFLPIFHVNGM